MGNETKWDQSVFDATLREYIEVNRTRTLPVIVNTKLFYIGRGAVRLTPKTDPWKITSTLGQMTTVNRLNKTGKRMVKRRLAYMVKAGRADLTKVPLAAAMINSSKRRQDRGLAPRKGLYGAAMADAIRKLLGGRHRTVAYLKSGWLPGIAQVGVGADKSKAPPGDSAARVYGEPKGMGIPAQTAPAGTMLFKAMMENRAGTRKDQDMAALHKYGTRPLEQAYRDEERSMRDFMEQQMAKDAAEFNRKQRNFEV